MWTAKMVSRIGQNLMDRYRHVQTEYDTIFEGHTKLDDNDLARRVSVGWRVLRAFLDEITDSIMDLQNALSLSEGTLELRNGPARELLDDLTHILMRANNEVAEAWTRFEDKNVKEEEKKPDIDTGMAFDKVIDVVDEWTQNN